MSSAAFGGDDPPRWLLIGNSRWHWAHPTTAAGELRLRHTDPPCAALGDSASRLLGWAATGPVPAAAGLPPELRLTLTAVPLAAMPPWLGIDRALAGWQAWRSGGGAVLVADAGTVLSLTRVRADGAFAGGRLMAGVSLQWRAMASGTVALPLPAPQDPVSRGPLEAGPDPWPAASAAAMRSGVLLGLAAAVAAAFEAACSLDPGCRLVLTGGDGPTLLDPLRRRLAGMGLVGRLSERPALALEALAALAPLQASPRSARI